MEGLGDLHVLCLCEGSACFLFKRLSSMYVPQRDCLGLHCILNSSPGSATQQELHEDS